MKKALVFGITGQLGIAVAERLLKTGWQVWGAARGDRAPPIHLMEQGLRPINGPNDSCRSAFRELGHSVDAAFVPTAYDIADATDLLADRSWVGSLVVLSSSSVYADSAGRSLDEAAETGFPIFNGPF